MDQSPASSPPRARAVRALALLLPLVLGGATAAAAGSASFRDGELSIHVPIGDLDPLTIPTEPPLASGQLFATRVGDTLVALSLPAGVFDVTGLNVPIVPPVGLVGGVELTAANGAGSFTTVGGDLTGPMPIVGTLTICGPAACPGMLAFEVPLDVVGVGGTFAEDFGFFTITLEGAPWTLGPVSIPSDTQGGSIVVSGGIAPIAGPGSDLEVELVTPIEITTTEIPGYEVVPAWASLRLVVPEPDGPTLGLGAVGSLLLIGRSHRRRA